MSRTSRPPKQPVRTGERREVDIDAVMADKPSHGVLLQRGLAKRCPRCGGGHIYQGWFRMKERCPSCGYLFEREPGFFVGAYLINFAIAEGFLWVLLMGFILWKSAHPEAGLVLPLVIGLVIGVVGPIIFYPYSRTIWSAIDLAMTPLELAEIIDAADAVGASTSSPEVEPDPPVVTRSDDSGDAPGSPPG